MVSHPFGDRDGDSPGRLGTAGGRANPPRFGAMRQALLYKIPVFLAVAACVALVAAAVFSGDAPSPGGVDELSLLSLCRPDARTARVSTVVKAYRCPQCSSRIDWGCGSCPRCGWSLGRLRLVRGGAAPSAPSAAPLTGQDAPRAAMTSVGVLLSPREQNAAGKEFIEGHWLGLEVIPLIPALAKEYRLPQGETGVLVDEITLEAAESGILAGDVIRSIEGRPTPDLRAFFLATQRVREQERARIEVSRRGGKRAFVIEARNTRELGFAQMEAAQPIAPGAISPHRQRRKACTDCHIIMRTGGQLPTDAGDLLPQPPSIARGAKPPHRERGRCSACHVVR